MSNHTALRRLAAATLAGGALAVTPVLVPAASAAPSCPAYAGTISTTTSVSVSDSTPTQVSTFTATATVTNDATGAPVSGGSVAFSYADQSQNAAVSGGSATATFTARTGQATLRAQYSGVCVGGVAAVDSSSDGQVLGVEANGGSNSGSNRPGSGLAGVENGTGTGSGSSTGGLAATGADTQTELLAALGLGLVAVGGLSLTVHRRRVRA